MYRFSRSIYRTLSPLVVEDRRRTGTARRQLLEASEATVSRMVFDRRYFANPTRSLFEQVRHLFAVPDQLHVRTVIDRNLKLASDYLARMPSEHASMLGSRSCKALTRQGTPCRRKPLPERDFCPSHKHLEAVLGSAAQQPRPIGLDF